MKNRKYKYRHVSNMYLAKSMVNLCVNMGTRVPDNVSAVDDIFNELFGADRFASRVIRCEDSKMILFMIDKYVGRNNLERLVGSKSLMMAMRDLINLVCDIKHTRNRIKDRQKHGKNVDALKKELKFYNKAYKKTIIEFKSYLNLNAKGYKNKYKGLMNFIDSDKDGIHHNFGLGDFFDDDLIDEDEEEYSKYNEFYRLPDVYTQEDLDTYNAYMDYQRMMGNAPDFKNGSFKMMNPGNNNRNNDYEDYNSSSGYSILDGLSDDQIAELGEPDDDDDEDDYEFDAYIYGEDYANRRYGRGGSPYNHSPRRNKNIQLQQQNMYDPRIDKMMDMMSTLISLQSQNVNNQSSNITPQPKVVPSTNAEVSELKNQIKDLSKVVYDVIEYLTEDEDDDEIVVENKTTKPVVEEDPAIAAFNKLINGDDSEDIEEEIDEDEYGDEDDEDDYEDIDPEIFHLPYREFLNRVHEYGIKEGDVAYKQLVTIYKEYWEKLKAQADAQLAKEKAEKLKESADVVEATEVIATDNETTTEYSEMDREELVNEFNNSESVSTKMVNPPSGATTL